MRWTGVAVDAVVGNELDVAVTSTPIDHPLVEVGVVGREELLVVATTPALDGAPGVGSAAGPWRADDLRGRETVSLHEMHCLGRTINEFCSTRRLATNVVCRMTQIDTLLEFVRLGLGVSIVPQMVAERDGNSGRDFGRRYLRFKSHPPTRAIALAWRTGRSRSTLARRLAELLRDLNLAADDRKAAHPRGETRSAPPAVSRPAVLRGRDDQ